MNWMEKRILVIFLEILFVSSFTTSSARFSKFDIRNVILFQIKFFGRNIKETTLARYFKRFTKLTTIFTVIANVLFTFYLVKRVAYSMLGQLLIDFIWDRITINVAIGLHWKVGLPSRATSINISFSVKTVTDSLKVAK